MQSWIKVAVIMYQSVSYIYIFQEVCPHHNPTFWAHPDVGWWYRCWLVPPPPLLLLFSVTLTFTPIPQPLTQNTILTCIVVLPLLHSMHIKSKKVASKANAHATSLHLQPVVTVLVLQCLFRPKIVVYRFIARVAMEPVCLQHGLL